MTPEGITNADMTEFMTMLHIYIYIYGITIYEMYQKCYIFIPLCYRSMIKHIDGISIISKISSYNHPLYIR